MAVKHLPAGSKLSMLCYPATEHEKMSAVATKWAAIHRGRHVRNPPPEIPIPGAESSDDDEENDPSAGGRGASGKGRYSSPSSKRALRRQRALSNERTAAAAAAAAEAGATPQRQKTKDRTGRWYTAPTFTPGQEQALRKIQAAGRGHITRLEIDRSRQGDLSRSLSYDDPNQPPGQPPPSPQKVALESMVRHFSLFPRAFRVLFASFL